MHRLNKAFFVLTVSLALLGGVSVVDYSQTLGDFQDAGIVAEQIETEIRSGEVAEGEFVLQVEIRNPTRFTLDLNGAYMAASADGDRLAYGPIVNHDEIPETIPARGAVNVEYVFALSDDQAQGLQAVLDDGTVTVTGQHSVQLRDTQFSVSFTGEVDG
ncbi:MAG: hypothetical protein V5A38_04370 [Halolamina sp.]|uniref:hypothetical protein n=1 Tax=Halolamina sp. TaxID=1940283 RepID=UPI002FC274B7